MTRFIAGSILALAIFAVFYAATARVERHPLLIDAQVRPVSTIICNPVLTGPGVLRSKKVVRA